MGAAAQVVGRLKGGRELVRFACELDAAACATDATDPSKGGSQWIHILPHGPHVEARDGRSFTVEDIHKVLDATETPMLVDWEHASESGTTVAAGWVEELEVRTGEPETAGIWGRVKWTPAGREHVRAQAYRFLSPVVLGRRANSDRKHLAVEQLASVALTNRPALRMHGIEAFRMQLSERFGALDDEGDEDTMKELIKRVREACGLAEGATEGELVAALDAKLKPQPSDSLREALSTMTSERTALTTQVEKLERDLAAFQGEAFGREVEVFFDKGSRAGKIAPAARKKWLAFASKNRENFATFKDVIYPELPVLVPPDGKGQKTNKRARLSSLSPHGVDREALRRFGFTDAQIAEAEGEVFGGGGPKDAPVPAPGVPPVPPDEDDETDDDDEDDAAENDAADGGDTTDKTAPIGAPPAGG